MVSFVAMRAFLSIFWPLQSALSSAVQLRRGLSTAGALSPLAALVAGAGAYSIVDRWAASTPVNDGKTERSATAAAKASKG